MKIYVELTEKGEENSKSGRKSGLRGRVVDIGKYFQYVTVLWDNETWGRYKPDEGTIKIIGWTNEEE
jgi:hypothetical protein